MISIKLLNGSFLLFTSPSSMGLSFCGRPYSLPPSHFTSNQLKFLKDYYIQMFIFIIGQNLNLK